MNRINVKKLGICFALTGTLILFGMYDYNDNSRSKRLHNHFSTSLLTRIDTTSIIRKWKCAVDEAFLWNCSTFILDGFNWGLL